MATAQGQHEAGTAPQGILLVNLGTPDSPDVPAVRRYLGEFLSDPMVIDLPAPLRFLLVRAVILPFRPRRSAALYQKIWTDRGSPLRVHGEDLAARVRQATGRPVALGMRYGNPSVTAAVDALAHEGVEAVQIFPLFPQFSEAAWKSTAQAAERAVAERGLRAMVQPPFFAHPAFLDAMAERVRSCSAEFAPDHLLMSFHSVPERHLRRADPRCLATPDCCAALDEANRDCYRAQCYATARELARRLELDDDRWEVSFQSRMGRTPWIRPFTDERITALAEGGCRRLAVVCPAFVADCLETLEEIGMAGREQFLRHGGEDLHLVPALNSEPGWASAIAMILAAEVRSGCGEAPSKA